MAYVPGFDHDVFISYAHVNDEVVLGQKHGWVTHFIDRLQTYLDMKLGRRDAAKLWVDHDLAKHVDITPEIMGGLDKTATLLVVLSPGYLASEWCGRERDRFLKMVETRRRDHASGVFIVEFEKIPRDEWPEEFGDRIGYKFWIEDAPGSPPRTLGFPVPDPTDREYAGALNDLIHELAEELKAQRERHEHDAADAVGDRTPQTDPAGDESTSVDVGEEQRVVLLAEATDDIDPVRSRVRRHLEQAGICVAPDLSYYPRDPVAFVEAVDRDLGGAAVFAQLLSPVAGRKPPGLEQGYIACQYERAVEEQTRRRTTKLPVLQWRDPKTTRRVLNAVADEEHRLLLTGVYVHATPLEEFCAAVVRAARAPLAPEPPDGGVAEGTFIFVDYQPDDVDLAEELCGILRDRRIGFSRALHAGEPEAIRRDLEDNLATCDGLMVVYGTISNAWVREQFRRYRKIKFVRDQPVRALALVEGPPAQKDDLGVHLPDLLVLDCRDGVDPVDLVPFFQALGERHGNGHGNGNGNGHGHGGDV